MESAWSWFMWVRMPAGGRGERVWGGVGVGFGLDPAHGAEASDVVELDGREAEEAEVAEVDPVAGLRVAGKVELASLVEVVSRDGFGCAEEGGACGSERVRSGVRGAEEEACARVGGEVLGVHGHVADEEERAACGIERVGHERAEGKAGVLAGEGGEGRGGGLRRRGCGRARRGRALGAAVRRGRSAACWRARTCFEDTCVSCWAGPLRAGCSLGG